jgi:Fic family protein
VTYPELTPQQQARAILEARIQILVNEAIATSAIEGITLDPKEVRRAAIRRMAEQEGLL